MRVDEMKHFFHQTLVSMADTLERATSEDKMAADMRDFCHHLRKNYYNLKKFIGFCYKFNTSCPFLLDDDVKKMGG